MVASLVASSALLACGSEHSAAAPGNFVCFSFATDDWGQIGTFQQRFFAGPTNEMLPGMTGFHLTVKDTSVFSVTLQKGVDQISQSISFTMFSLTKPSCLRLHAALIAVVLVGCSSDCGEGSCYPPGTYVDANDVLGAASVGRQVDGTFLGGLAR